MDKPAYSEHLAYCKAMNQIIVLFILSKVLRGFAKAYLHPPSTITTCIPLMLKGMDELLLLTFCSIISQLFLKKH